MTSGGPGGDELKMLSPSGPPQRYKATIGPHVIGETGILAVWSIRLAYHYSIERACASLD